MRPISCLPFVLFAAALACSSEGSNVSAGGGSGGSAAGGAPSTAGSSGTPGTVADGATTPSCGSDAPTEPGVVVTDSGAVRGVGSGETWSFRKIPYAEPPVGPLRFKPPATAACSPGVRDASTWGPLCPQFDDSGAVVGEEDCLQLNVWTPKSPASDKLPVLFWIHGGGHIQGGASSLTGAVRLYDGQAFAERTGVVLVSINYRLGPLGFLGHAALTAESSTKSSANYGTLDQLAALGWVKRNIAGFAGDPARVTIFGESAGGVSVCALLASPLAKGLFSAAIIESGGCNAHTLAEEEAFGTQLFQAAGCQQAPDPTACMRALPVDAVLKALPVEIDVAGKPSIYGAVIEGHTLVDTPSKVLASGKHNHVPVIVGNNDAETARTAPLTIQTEADYEAAVRAAFLVAADAVLQAYPASAYRTPRAAYVALSSDAKFVCGARRAAMDLDANQLEPVHRYVFAHLSDSLSPVLKTLGAWHGLEVPYVFGTLAGLAGFMPDAADERVSSEMQHYWARFAATGDPNDASAVSWPPYAPEDPYLRFANPITAEQGFHLPQCEFWDALGKSAP
jgi:para-nitrobenzyl esterase